ncbi:MAG TPA: VWA domain-containing protein [Ktedonobacteraceae bacterium]|nr:VWA domain-containing protein [Ktedonobacteraceae bacterium]
MAAISETERLRRWRLVLGKDSAEGMGMFAGGAASDGMAGGEGFSLSEHDLGMDGVLEALYDADKSNVGMGSSSPKVARWLGDIRTYFPSSTVRIMQQDALQRLNLTQMLLEPEMLEQVDADVHLVATLLSLSKVIPEKTKDTARQVVRKVVEEMERKLTNPLIQAVRGSLNRATRTYRPRPNEIDWDRTIRVNLKNYLPEQGTIIAERLVGHGHKRSSLRDIVLCVDQSGSMATSVVYSGIFGAVLASIKAISTRMIVYDTSVVDLTDDLQDPVDLLFGTQLGGGNDTPRALTYCQQVITRPTQTILVLITDLYEGHLSQEMLRRAAEIVNSGVQMICLLALDDRGTPSFDRNNAAKMAKLGIPTFSCTPDLFPDLMAAAIQKQDLGAWAARNDIVAARGEE